MNSPILDDLNWRYTTKSYEASFTITDRDVTCVIPESDGGTVIIPKDNPEATHLEEVLGTQIQIYDHPELKERIAESLFYTHSKTKEQVALPFAAILRDCVDARIKNKIRAVVM